MLILDHIHLHLKHEVHQKIALWKDLSFSLKKGEWVMVMGPNGVGKSSLFNMLLGILQPECGQIILDGEDITHQDQSWRSRFISCVMQDPKNGTMAPMTLFENLAFAYRRGDSRGLKWSENQERKVLFEKHLASLNMQLEHRLFDRVQDLSGGQRQALSLMMATVKPCKLLLLDEITAALDPKSSKQIMNLTKEIVAQQQQTCLMITHDIPQALTYGDRLLILKKGEIFAFYTQEEKAKLTFEKLYNLLT